MPVNPPASPDVRAAPGHSGAANSPLKTGSQVAWMLLAIGLVAFGLRVAVVTFHPQKGHWFHEDTIFYLENAQAILNAGLPTLNKAPLGFSYILAALLKLGFDLTTIAFVIQPLAGAIDCLLVFVLCSRFGQSRAGLLAAALCAVHPSLLNSSSQVLSEDWAMLFFLLGLIAASSHKKRLLFPAGLLLGFACAIRSPCLAMLLGLLVWLCWTDRAKGFRRVALVGLGAALPILAVSIHLGIASHSTVFLTLQSSEADTVKPVLGGFEALDPQTQRARGCYFEFAMSHPLQFAQERMVSFLTFASPWPFGDDRPLMRKWILCISDGVVLLASLLAAYALGRRRTQRGWFVLLWLPCCMCLFYTLFFSNPRYRVPTLPLLIGFSAMVFLPRVQRIGFKRQQIPGG